MSNNQSKKKNNSRRRRKKNGGQNGSGLRPQQQQRRRQLGPGYQSSSANRLATVKSRYPTSLTNPGSLNTIIAKQDYSSSWRHYIQAVVEPESVGKVSMVNREILDDVRIPDTCLFPCTITQTKTTGTISPDNLGGFILWFYPYMKAGFNLYSTDGYSTGISSQCNGLEFLRGNATYDIYGYDNWADSITSYRVISMSVKVWYVGELLNQSGKLVGSCLSPFSQNINTFSELSAVPYSFQSKMVDGIRQVWFPFDYRSVESFAPDDEPGFDQVPSITIIGADINGFDATNPKFTIQFECYVNYEIYSNSQLFNNKAIAKPSHVLAGPVAKAAIPQVIAKNGGGTTTKSHDILGFIKDAVGVAETVAKVATPFLALL